jgi:RNA polymerase sigma-70 factor (ECF subfamily)
MQSPDRQATLDRALRGDAEALGELLQSYRPYLRVLVHAFGRHNLRARFDDSDLIQDALVEVQQSFATFRGTTVAEFLSWLRRIVIRTANRTIRRIAGTAKRNPAREQAVANLEAVADDSATPPSGRAMRHEQAARMAEALDRLAPGLQHVLLARHVDGLPHAVIAGQMGRTEAAVRMLYLRALRQLRTLYRE